MMTMTFLSPSGVAPDVLVDPEHPHPVDAGGVGDQDPTARAQDRVVGGVPRDPEALSDPGDGQVLTDDPFERSPRRVGLARGSAALLMSRAPGVPATRAPAAANRDQQRGGAPAERRSSTGTAPRSTSGITDPEAKRAGDRRLHDRAVTLDPAARGDHTEDTQTTDEHCRRRPELGQPVVTRSVGAARRGHPFRQRAAASAVRWFTGQDPCR